MMYTARLMQDSGVAGPHTQFEADDLESAAAEARAWAKAQTGHPWDTLTIVDEDDGRGYTVTPEEVIEA